MTDTPREPDNHNHPDQGEVPHPQADTSVRTDDGDPSRLSDSPHEQQPPPDSPDTDLVLGDTTGVVLTFSSAHGFIHTDRFGPIFVHKKGLATGCTWLRPGQRVSARILQGKRGRYAYGVQVLTADTITVVEDTPHAPEHLPLTQNLIALVARRLREKDPIALSQIRRLYNHFGTDIMWGMIAETERIEAEGGMLLVDGSRRRTPGGVFLFLAKKRLSREERTRIFSPKPQTNPQSQNSPQSKQTPVPAPIVEKITWDTRASLIGTVRKGQGKAHTVRIMVNGRPTSVVERGSMVILTLTHNGPLPTVPKGVLIPPVVPTTTTVAYVSARQWRGVAEAMVIPDEELVIEGAMIWDAKQRAIAVYATKITSKQAQRATRTASPTTPTPAKNTPT